ALLDTLTPALQRAVDRQNGGLGSAPKFPPHGALDWLLATGEAEVSSATLAAMALGGIHDHLGGGFHRYSTDERWLVPHFEKMLYDNALLVPAYLEAFLATRRDSYADVARACCEWALREMLTASGGFASSQDADSEGEE